MTDDRSLERAARSWIESGPTRAPDRAVEAALDRIQQTPQERDLRIPWRVDRMNRTARLIGAAAALIVIVGGAIALLGRPGSNVGVPPTQTAPTSTLVPPQGSPVPLITFTSTVYGYTIDYPADWTARNATRRLSGLELPLDTSPGVDTLSLPVDRYGGSTGGPHGTIYIGSGEVAPGTALAPWSASQAQAICGAATTQEDVAIDGEAGRFLSFSACNGNPIFAMFATALHGTSGFYVAWANDPGTETFDRALFEKILATFAFPKGTPASPAPS
ncbi:MAG TPA: hypothetical protein VKC59_07100 [Candidatus Limnocylindrales bacterium]|nr:hypothetical protein [Candidatus Limnocylindrales bacterium]